MCGLSRFPGGPVDIGGQQPVDWFVPWPFYADFSSSVSQLLNTLWVTLTGQGVEVSGFIFSF